MGTFSTNVIFDEMSRRRGQHIKIIRAFSTLFFFWKFLVLMKLGNLGGKCNFQSSLESLPFKLGFFFANWECFKSVGNFFSQ